jgi:hypothetical protein
MGNDKVDDQKCQIKKRKERAALSHISREGEHGSLGDAVKEKSVLFGFVIILISVRYSESPRPSAS